MAESKGFIPKAVLLWLCVAVFSVARGEELGGYSGPNESLHIYLLIGQSNMAGRAPFSEKQAHVLEGVYLFNGEAEWEPAKNPLNRYSTIRKDIKMQRMNPGYRFSQVMQKRSKGAAIGLVANAKGGTRIEQWEKGTEFYEEAIRCAKEAQKTGLLKGILWHQGESNSRKPDGYLDKLETVIEDLRRDLAVPELPFVAGQLFYHPEGKAHTKQMNDLLITLPKRVSFTACVRSKGLTAEDHTHFDSKSMIRLGDRYAKAMWKLQRKR